jgi:hypothetical protein
MWTGGREGSSTFLEVLAPLALLLILRVADVARQILPLAWNGIPVNEVVDWGKRAGNFIVRLTAGADHSSSSVR